MLECLLNVGDRVRRLAVCLAVVHLNLADALCGIGSLVSARRLEDSNRDERAVARHSSKASQPPLLRSSLSGMPTKRPEPMLPRTPFLAKVARTPMFLSPVDCSTLCRFARVIGSRSHSLVVP